MEDLWAFNDESLAREVYASRLPVISAVGHETDVTISDYVADVRAPTPSAAAEIVSGTRDDLKATVSSLFGRLLQAVRLHLDRRRLALLQLARNRAFEVAPNKIREFQQRFDEITLRMIQEMRGFVSGTRHRCSLLHTRLSRVDLVREISGRKESVEQNWQLLVSNMRLALQREQSRFELAVGRMDALSPLAILKRGYAICRTESGVILRDAAGVERGDRVDVTLSRGELACRVEQAKKALEED
jgi:exodeoxyribonuclease VII large subunit